MQCTIDHEIIIENFRTNESVEHEIIIIKGFVNNKNCQLESPPLVSLVHVSPTVVAENCDRIPQDFAVSLTTGRFKLLVQLKKGINHFQIAYCRAIKEFQCTYRETQNTEKEFGIQPLYIICKGDDGNFNALKGHKNDPDEAVKRITLGVKLAQSLFAEKISEHNLERKTFTLNSDCTIFQSDFKVSEIEILDEVTLWNIFAKEILNSDLGENDRLKFVAFISCTSYHGVPDKNYSYENIRKNTKAHVNLGGGGLAIFGSACIYSWPSKFDEIISCFENQEKIDLCNYFDDSNYRRTVGGCYSTSFGALVHEMGHIFDLGHTIDGIMGSGFDYANLCFRVADKTQKLPRRIVKAGDLAHVQKDKRLTRIQQQGVEYLQKHHEQRTNDSIYFTRSCALILYHHRWFNRRLAEATSNTRIAFDATLLSLKSTNSPIRIIEIREKINGLVLGSLEFLLKDTQTLNLNLQHKFKNLPSIDLNIHNVFVITSDGSTELFT